MRHGWKMYDSFVIFRNNLVSVGGNFHKIKSYYHVKIF